MYTCTLHMRNRKKSVQKLVKLSYDRRHLNLNLKLHSSPNVICMVSSDGVKRWHICGFAYNPFPVLLDMCLIIPESSSGLQYTWHTAHSHSKGSALTLWTSNYVLVIDILLISYVNSSRIILFLKTLPVHAWACICHRWRDTSVGTTVGKMFPGDAHYEWI